MNFVFSFLIAQVFLSMLCTFKFGIFWFFAGWVFLGTAYIYFLLPETKNVPIETLTEEAFGQHKVWSKIVATRDFGDGGVDVAAAAGKNKDATFV